LTEEADIYQWNFWLYRKQYNFNQAVQPLSSLDVVFENLVINPEIGRKRNEIKIGLNSIYEQEHIIFYRLLKDNIRIVRVLHGSKDMPRHFKK